MSLHSDRASIVTELGIFEEAIMSDIKYNSLVLYREIFRPASILSGSDCLDSLAIQKFGG